MRQHTTQQAAFVQIEEGAGISDGKLVVGASRRQLGGFEDKTVLSGDDLQQRLQGRMRRKSGMQDFMLRDNPGHSFFQSALVHRARNGKLELSDIGKDTTGGIDRKYPLLLW